MSEPRTKGRLTALLVVAVVVLLAALGAVTTSLQPVCRTCHSVQAAALAKDPHASVTCYSCHLDNGAWGYPEQKTLELAVMYPTKWFRAGKPTRQVEPTSRQSCLACHEAVLGPVVGTKGLRIKHSTCAAGSTCDSCHASVAHGYSKRQPQQHSMEDCIACHREQRATVACDACHVGRRQSERKSTGPWQITHGPNWESTHGLGRLDSCSACHTEDKCRKCHNAPVPHPKDFGGTHGRWAKESTEGCFTCHKVKAFCDNCHLTPMPHPVGFLQKHSSLVKDPDDPACHRCHSIDDCDRCHENHVHPGGAKGLPTVPKVGGSR